MVAITPEFSRLSSESIKVDRYTENVMRRIIVQALGASREEHHDEVWIVQTLMSYNSCNCFSFSYNFFGRLLAAGLFGGSSPLRPMQARALRIGIWMPWNEFNASCLDFWGVRNHSKCSICPFMIYGELVQRWQQSTGAKFLKWPREAFERYGPWFLFSLFGAILVWEEVWDLPHSAALSGWLLVLITAGAVGFSAFFERRIWCRYLCPIGGMNGMMAKISMTEVRARQGVCTGECTTYNCYKGGCNPAKPEGIETNGCPLYSHPAQLVDNSNCTNCMTCLKACPNGSVEFRIRPPGIELWTTHEPSVPQLTLLAMHARRSGLSS